MIGEAIQYFIDDLMIENVENVGRRFHSPEKVGEQPFLFATLLGLIGCVMLFIFDRFCPIRQPLPENTPAVELNDALKEGGVTEA